MCFEIFKEMEGEGASNFSHKNERVGKIGGVVLKVGGVSLIFILTNPSQCYPYLSVCVFSLFIPFPSVLFVFHRKKLCDFCK